MGQRASRLSRIWLKCHAPASLAAHRCYAQAVPAAAKTPHLFRLASLLLTVFCSKSFAASAGAKSETIKFGRFGDVTVLHPESATRAAIFLSGDGGFSSGVVDMAKMLVAKDYLVIGVDLPKYLRNAAEGNDRCLYPPGDLQRLSQFVQKRLGSPRYFVPVIVGYSSGATLAYGALAQAPEGTFQGAISLGFCPDIETKKPLCKGEGLTFHAHRKGKAVKGYDLEPFVKGLSAPWYVLNGRSDQVCDLQATEKFVAKTPKGHLVPLGKVGHGFGVKKRWQPAFERAVRDVAAEAFAAQQSRSMPKLAAPETSEEKAAPPSDLPTRARDLDLPLVEVAAPLDSQATEFLAVLVSGDGGWATLDKDVAEALADAGVPVIGLDALQYFWNAKAPDQAGKDMDRLLRFYLKEWRRTKIIALGYSFGADVLPFLLTRLSPELRDQVTNIALISPSQKATFEFKVTDWFGQEPKVESYPVAPEVRKLKTNLLCFYGTDDKTALCPELQANATLVPLAGSHRLQDTDAIAAAILKAMGLRLPPAN